MFFGSYLRGLGQRMDQGGVENVHVVSSGVVSTLVGRNSRHSTVQIYFSIALPACRFAGPGFD
ncbi:hypothetical protein DMY87_00125 [Rhizobium wuzhouense]|uniref:Uncharacterized protein n=1 Tax=Rhizobium wuzhouense TaxID=1986026 RepID=A0ABX5NVD7_9HYPH|nr:hypothetical protein DMY87_00125 [Rhizobium wuzhouense]